MYSLIETLNMGSSTVTRRRLLASLGTGTVAGSAGCLGAFGSDSAETPDPVDLSGGKFDYQGGMEIGVHGGPNGQIFYADNEPTSRHATGNSEDAREDLAWFHTLVQGLFPYHFERLNRGWEPTAIYATDYSRVDWDLSGGDGPQQLPSPTAPDTFGDATELVYVAESDVIGGMGPELVPFSDTAEADSFASDYGGRTLEYDDITPNLIGSLGMR
jgi:nitrous oxide reductase accessory protein NosL